MKALTVWQPWASLIIAGAKPYEFRGWRAPRSIIGQRVVVHAAKRKPVLQEMILIEAALQAGGPRAAEVCLHATPALELLERAIDNLSSLPLSAGIGTAIIGEPRNGFDIAEEFGLPRVNDSDRDEHANWGWPMLEIEAWSEPVPARGMQGLWTWPTPAEVGL